MGRLRRVSLTKLAAGQALMNFWICAGLGCDSEAWKSLTNQSQYSSPVSRPRALKCHLENAHKVSQHCSRAPDRTPLVNGVIGEPTWSYEVAYSLEFRARLSSLTSKLDTALTNHVADEEKGTSDWGCAIRHSIGNVLREIPFALISSSAPRTPSCLYFSPDARVQNPRNRPQNRQSP